MLDILFYKKKMEIKKKRFSAMLTKCKSVSFSRLYIVYQYIGAFLFEKWA